ncbi:hypothetical protein TWF694_005256 [Orbilia ellipsospora]|uniref:Uncharacterized protein n=1 Tax=Orbilia ellipsospora TaxID=2528407 RepID=A0AAV9WSW7_9PEZI
MLPQSPEPPPPLSQSLQSRWLPPPPPPSPPPTTTTTDNTEAASKEAGERVHELQREVPKLKTLASLMLHEVALLIANTSDGDVTAKDVEHRSELQRRGNQLKSEPIIIREA